MSPTALSPAILSPAMAPPVLPAHGIGGAQDLPIPLGLAVGAALAALLVSFGVLARAWRTPWHQVPGPGRPAPRWLQRMVDSAGFRWAARLLSLAFFGYLTWALVAGPDLVSNPVFGTFYVLVWVGIVPFSLLLGPVVRLVSPVRTLNLLLARATGGDARTGLTTYPAVLGYWPAALGLFAFVWQELVDPQSAYLATVRLWLAVYVAVMLIGAAVFGDTWLARADPFEVYSTLVSTLSFWGRDDEGRLVRRNPLENLAALRPDPGLLAVVAVLFGSTAFDTYKEKLTWTRFLESLPVPSMLANTLGLAVFCLAVAVTFRYAAMSTAVDPGTVRRRDLPGLLAHTIIPIVVGYITAHYLTFFVEQGQLTLIQLSDPMSRGDNYLLTANWSVFYGLSFHPAVLAVVKVAAIVAGHVVGVVAAHDRAISLLPPRHHVRGQLGMLVLMLVYTATGLYLLMSS